MHGGKPAELRCSVRSELDANLPVILAAADPFDEALTREPIHQPDGAVVADDHVLGEFPDGRALAGAKRPDGEQDLVLLGFQSFGAGGLLAEVEESANSVAELAEGAVVSVSHSEIYRSTILPAKRRTGASGPAAKRQSVTMAP